MKKLLTFFALCFVVIGFSQHKVATKVAEYRSQNVAFTHIALLSVQNGPAGSDVSRALKQETLATLDLTAVNEILSHRYQTLQVEVPYMGQTILVDLYQSTPFHDGFHVDTDKSARVNYNEQSGVYYRGIIHGDVNSVASFNFFHNNMNAIVSGGTFANLVIGKLDRPQNVTDYVIYSDSDLRVPSGFNCNTKEAAMHLPGHSTNRSALTQHCVTMYFEIDYNLYLANNESIDDTTNWMTSVFNNVQTLYENDGITVALKSLYIWTEQDPYEGIGDQSVDYLYLFGETRPVFDGDVGQLVGIDEGGLGGVAVTIDGLCSQYNFSYSDVNQSFSNVPTYSWTVQVITHEMGHLLGSRHTHACAWNGNDTAIDGCGQQAGYHEGSCENGPIPSPSEKGTIMSYCHLIQGVGISFSNGFGPQPAAAIQNAVNSASCLSSDCINTCINTVTTITVTNPTPTTVAVNWTDIGSSTIWEVSIVPFGSTDDNWVTVNTNSYAPSTSFTPNTFYEVRVRPVCDNVDESSTRRQVFVTPANWCNGVVITDTGGTSGDYTDEQLYIRTLIPNLSQKKIKLTFTQFDLEDGYDYLTIYDGPNTDATSLGSFTGTFVSSPVTSTSPDGSLTIKFFSDQGVTAAGYTANVICLQNLGVDQVAAVDFTYAPNPTTGSVNILSNTEMTAIKVYNVQGQLLYNGKNAGLNKFVDLSAFASGTYFFKIKFGEKEANFRIIKN